MVTLTSSLSNRCLTTNQNSEVDSIQVEFLWLSWSFLSALLLSEPQHSLPHKDPSAPSSKRSWPPPIPEPHSWALPWTLTPVLYPHLYLHIESKMSFLTLFSWAYTSASCVYWRLQEEGCFKRQGCACGRWGCATLWRYICSHFQPVYTDSVYRVTKAGFYHCEHNLKHAHRILCMLIQLCLSCPCQGLLFPWKHKPNSSFLCPLLLWDIFLTAMWN